MTVVIIGFIVGALINAYIVLGIAYQLTPNRTPAMIWRRLPYALILGITLNAVGMKGGDDLELEHLMIAALNIVPAFIFVSWHLAKIARRNYEK